MSRAVLSVGSNVGDRMHYLRAVVAALRPDLLAVSSVYQTAPWGGVRQESFFNAVLCAEGDGDDAWEWLHRCHELEQAAGRRREARWGPRTLDVDVILVVDDGGSPVLMQDAELTLPHPLAHERAFVLVPWLEIDPAAYLPGHGPIADLAQKVADQQIERRTDLALL